jgi:hypothetical protein
MGLTFAYTREPLLNPRKGSHMHSLGVCKLHTNDTCILLFDLFMEHIRHNTSDVSAVSQAKPASHSALLPRLFNENSSPLSETQPGTASRKRTIPTATCLRNVVLTFADIGMSHGQRSGSPTAVNLSFLDRSRYFYFT